MLIMRSLAGLRVVSYFDVPMHDSHFMQVGYVI
jgi:hypothetical protein